MERDLLMRTSTAVQRPLGSRLLSAQALPRILLALLWLLVTASVAMAEEPAVPKKYQLLYATLETQLNAFEARLPKMSGERTLIRGAILESMRCAHPESLLSETRRENAMRELDALRRAGAQAIVIEICYPLLSPGFQDPRALLEHYANLANEVRRRDMKLVVEHGALGPKEGIIVASRFYQRMTKQRFAEERYAELKSIAIALQPDYLTMVTDPRTQSAGLKLSAKDWNRYVSSSIAALRHELGDFVQALGAGVGLWYDVGYLDAFAAAPGLDYVDLRLYPLVMGRDNSLDRLLSWPDRIREIDPAKRILVSQAWLYKAGGEDAATPVADPDIEARGVYGFWAPLDARYLRAVARAARLKDIEFMASRWNSYFFAYLDFYDPATFKAVPRRLIELEEQRASGAMSRNELTATGKAFSGL
jgi:hypothetical protein